MLTVIRLGAVLMAVAVLNPLQANAQRQPVLEYAVRLVCGQADRPAVAPGTYFTAINIHNPGPAAARAQYKAATTLPNTEPGRVSPFSGIELEADQALEIDCRDAWRLAQEQEFLKGFVIVQSDTPLDVVAVYTASGARQYRWWGYVIAGISHISWIE
jgi:hypothetical protein